MSKTDNYIIDLHNKDVEIKELKEDRQIVYDTACELVEYIENTEHIETEELDLLIARIQNFSK